MIVIAYVMRRIAAGIAARQDNNTHSKMILKNSSMKEIQGRAAMVMVIAVLELKVVAIFTIASLVRFKRSTR